MADFGAVAFGPVSAVPGEGSAASGTPTPSPPPSITPPAGFALNGATNAAWAAALGRVKAGSGRAKIVWKGDSTTVGQGGGTSNFALTGAAPARIPTRAALRLTSAGYPALDQGVTGDFGIRRATNGQDLIAPYDARLTIDRSSGAWEIQDGDPIRAAFAGAAFWQPSDSTAKTFQFKADSPVNRFEIIVYDSNNETYDFRINGAAPTVGPAQGTTTGAGGFKRFVVGVAAAGLHTLQISGQTRAGAFRGLFAYDAATPGIDMILHAALGTKAENLAASGGSWSNKEALEFDAPDLTVIQIGLNDMNAGTSPSSYSGSLGSMIDSAKLSGDVLLVFPFPAGSPYNNNVAAMRDAASAIAASKGVSFLSLYDYFGPFDSAQAAKMQDGVVHPNASYYDEIADVVFRGMASMAPSAFSGAETAGTATGGATVAGAAVTRQLVGGTANAAATVTGSARTVYLTSATAVAGATIAGAGLTIRTTSAVAIAGADAIGAAVTMRLTGATAAGQASVNGSGAQPSGMTTAIASAGAMVTGDAITVRLTAGLATAAAIAAGDALSRQLTPATASGSAVAIAGTLSGSASAAIATGGASVAGAAVTRLFTGALATGGATVIGQTPAPIAAFTLSFRTVTLSDRASRSVIIT